MKKIYVIFKMFLYMFLKRFEAIKYSSLKKRNPKEYEDKIFQMVREWACYILKIAKVTVETSGLENIPEGNCLFVSNHQSNLDIPIVLSQITKNTSFISKKELKSIPILSFWMKKIHCVFLDRDNIRNAINSINDAAKSLKEFCSIVVFPEGTRSKSNTLGVFKKGSLKFGLKAEVPIVPVTIYNSYKGFEDKGTFMPCTVKLIIGEPIYPDKLDKAAKNNLIDDIKAKIAENM